MSRTLQTIHIVGAGLAGSECALQLAERGYRVHLYEMRSQVMTPAHKTGSCAELVCSNSFGSSSKDSAPGQLKSEAEVLGSFILEAGLRAQVPAGQALGVDRHEFAKSITQMIHQHPNIQIENRLVEGLHDLPRPAVIATGPLTHAKLARSMQLHFGNDFLYFYDAIAPVISTESIDQTVAWRADRYDKGTGDYINCPMSQEQYEDFAKAIASARKIEPKSFEKIPYFEGCMPIEVLFERGLHTPRFGPMKPRGLRDPRTGQEPFAVVQLRQDNKQATAYNMVGFQTKMAYGDQKTVLRKIPGLEKAEFLKLGSIHRNLYLHSPKKLSPDLSSRKDPFLFFAGQITGVEGYFESACTGLLIAHFIDQKMRLRPFSPPPRASALGALLNAITEDKPHFQPTNINFGLFPTIEGVKKLERRELQLKKARLELAQWAHQLQPRHSQAPLTTTQKSVSI